MQQLYHLIQVGVICFIRWIVYGEQKNLSTDFSYWTMIEDVVCCVFRIRFLLIFDKFLMYFWYIFDTFCIFRCFMFPHFFYNCDMLLMIYESCLDRLWMMFFGSFGVSVIFCILCGIMVSHWEQVSMMNAVFGFA